MISSIKSYTLLSVVGRTEIMRQPNPASDVGGATVWQTDRPQQKLVPRCD